MQKTGGISNFPQCPSAAFNLGGFILQKRGGGSKDCVPPPFPMCVCTQHVRAVLQLSIVVLVFPRPGARTVAAVLTSVFTMSERGPRRVTEFSQKQGGRASLGSIHLFYVLLV